MYDRPRHIHPPWLTRQNNSLIVNCHSFDRRNVWWRLASLKRDKQHANRMDQLDQRLQRCLLVDFHLSSNDFTVNASKQATTTFLSNLPDPVSLKSSG